VVNGGGGGYFGIQSGAGELKGSHDRDCLCCGFMWWRRVGWKEEIRQRGGNVGDLKPPDEASLPRMGKSDSQKVQEQ
jgi:hypothetical protein